MRQYFFNLLVSLDQLANTILGGYPDETLSARSYRLSGTSKRWCITRHLINALFFNREHCKHAFYSEIDLPDDYR